MRTVLQRLLTVMQKVLAPAAKVVIAATAAKRPVATEVLEAKSQEPLRVEAKEEKLQQRQQLLVMVLQRISLINNKTLKV